ncbi:sulfatase [Marinilongibacter aquaticus]|uniref:sulfatase family protein n=1 Tax=Marinilongibacter aquaticus TaxID=2975157 RepID=UPI0021BD2A37|nr:sulfatase [Marinilongibacter aquaticus]UBM58389.1 sulfatase [Marinilongibacter aquaticus]
MKKKRLLFKISALLLLFTAVGHAQQKPNILWISVEDLSPRLAAYGDNTVSTPNIDRLAKEGIVYDNVFTSAGVCSPSRNAIITGRYQTSNGGQNMRTMNIYSGIGLPEMYNSVPPPEVKCFPEYLRAEGYYTTNQVKTDYQFTAPPTVWDEVSKTADWRGRENDRPFFTVVNYTTTHESQIWARADHKMRVDPKTVPLPPFYPDNEITRTDVARQYSNVSELDDQIGELLAKLEADGLMDKTIIFFWTDHGDGLPFYKREVYSRGMQIPLIVRFPDGKGAGTRDDRLISAIDFGPTVLSLAGIPTPSQMQGRAFLGEFVARPHHYIFGARDRVDSEFDRVRSAYDRQYIYVKNYHPEKPLYMDIKYRKGINTMTMLLEMHEKGELNAVQDMWFKPTKPAEELYDWKKDPFQLHNLAEDPAYAAKLIELRQALDNWTFDTQDLGAIPETEMLKNMWNGEDHQPSTAPPLVYAAENLTKIACQTPGASIAYRKKGANRWEVYTKPVELEKGEYETTAMRIGYKQSETISFRSK